jgi:hypothetical protein
MESTRNNCEEGEPRAQKVFLSSCRAAESPRTALR